MGAFALQALKTAILRAGFPPQFNLIVMAAVVVIVLCLQSPAVGGVLRARFARKAAP